MEKIKSFTHPYCEPCASCKAKLEAAEEMAKAMKTICNLPTAIPGRSVQEFAKDGFSAWEKVGKGKE